MSSHPFNTVAFSPYRALVPVQFSSEEGDFNSGTLALLVRNGVKIGCWAQSAKWHDDPIIAQTMQSASPFRGGVFFVSEDETIEEVFGDVRMATPTEFDEICKREGVTYKRSVRFGPYCRNLKTN